MPSWDNVQLPPPPSLVPPKADFSTLGEIVPAYYQGQQLQRQKAIQDAFKGGLPRTDPNDPNSPVDYKAMAQTYARLGATDQAINMMKLDRLSHPSQQATDPNTPEGQAELLRQQGGAAPQSGAAQPGMPVATLPRQTVSPTGYSGGDNGQNTVASFVTDALGNVPILGRAIVGVARSLGVDPNQPLTAEQQQKIAPVISRLTGAQPQPQGPQQGPMQPQPVEEQTAQEGPGGPGGLLLPQARAPQAQAQQPQQQAPQAQAQPQQQAPLTQLQSWQGPTPADAEMPDNLRGRVSPQSYRDYLLQQANIQRKYAQQENKDAAVVGEKFDTGPALAKAAQWEAQAKQITEALAPTELQKNVITGAATRDRLDKLAQENGEKQFQGIQAQSTQYKKDQKDYLGLSKNILNDPKMYTGIGADRVLDWNRIKATFGDTKGAALQELLQKVTATSALAQVNLQRDQMQEAAGPGGGRIFSQQVELVNKSIPQLGGTLQGNRALVEIQSRMGERLVDIHKLAIDYRRTHGYLDDGFQKQVSDYLDGHPLLNKLEMANPALLGVPTSPYSDPGQMSAWAQQMGLPPKAAVRTPGGKIVHVQPR